MQHTSPLITTIIAVYNMAETLQKAIDSATAQDYPRKELIIIEGASSDHTVDIIKDNNGVIDYWESVKPEERGIYSQWNRALPHVKGEWINFLGADDYFPANDVLSRIEPHLTAADGDVRLVYGEINMISPEGKRLWSMGKPWQEIKNLRYRSLPIPHPATFHHKSLFDIHGYFDESFKISGDYEFLLREIKNGMAEFVPGIVVRDMAVGGLSTSWKHDITRMLENARARKCNAMPAYTGWWFKMFIKRLIRNFLFLTIGPDNTRRIDRFLKK